MHLVKIATISLMAPCFKRYAAASLAASFAQSRPFEFESYSTFAVQKLLSYTRYCSYDSFFFFSIEVDLRRLSLSGLSFDSTWVES